MKAATMIKLAMGTAVVPYQQPKIHDTPSPKPTGGLFSTIKNKYNGLSPGLKNTVKGVGALGLVGTAAKMFSGSGSSNSQMPNRTI